jgi:putative ABC transport system permease protein
MFKNYLKIARRNIEKNKMYSSIKIGGLAVGIAACLLIALYIIDEISYDKHYKNVDRIYRVIVHEQYKGENEKYVWFPAAMAKALKDDYPEVEKAGRYLSSELFGAGGNQIRRTDQKVNTYEEGITYFDQELLDILEIPMVYGDAKQALNQPNTMVISKQKADKYFPGENPVGKTMIINNNDFRTYKIGGVMKDFPTTSHLKFDFLLSLKGMEFGDGEQSNWSNYNYPTYVLLKSGINVARLEKKLSNITKKYFLAAAKGRGDTNPERVLNELSFELQPVQDIHLKSAGISDAHPNGDIRFVWLFGGIAAFILIIACINFINLSTAKSANRAKEVGVRKVVGSHRRDLVKQFLTEAFLISFISFILGIGLAILFLPYFNLLSDKSLVIPFTQWWLLPAFILMIIIVAMLAGVYPSFYLSSFKPISVLKGNLSLGSKNAGMRGILVVFQFTISLILIVSTLVIYRQMEYILNKKVGYDKEQVLLLHGTNTMGDKIQTFKEELLALPEVKHVSVSDYLPVNGTKRNGNAFNEEGKFGEDAQVGGQFWRVDHDYLKTLGIKLIEGRDFSKEKVSDGQAAIINKQMVKKLGLEHPIGTRINNGSVWTVIGVVEDFHFESFKEEIYPLCLALGNSPNIISVKVKASDMAGSIKAISKVWKEFSPDQPIRYTFMDENFKMMYEDVQRMARIFTSFAILAVVIACLGLFALSAFMIEQRKKEIGIRLVLGSSLGNIFRLLTKDFIQLVLVSLTISMPVGWYFMQKWLEDYSYRTKISWDIFLIAGIVAIFIALLTISYQSVKAALIKPVESLKSE